MRAAGARGARRARGQSSRLQRPHALGSPAVSLQSLAQVTDVIECMINAAVGGPACALCLLLQRTQATARRRRRLCGCRPFLLCAANVCFTATELAGTDACPVWNLSLLLRPRCLCCAGQSVYKLEQYMQSTQVANFDTATITLGKAVS